MTIRWTAADRAEAARMRIALGEPPADLQPAPADADLCNGPEPVRVPDLLTGQTVAWIVSEQRYARILAQRFAAEEVASVRLEQVQRLERQLQAWRAVWLASMAAAVLLGSFARW